MAKDTVVSNENKHPLEGMVTTIYLDPVNKKDKEGRAKIIKVTGSEAINKTQTLYSVEIHYIGDRRGFNVNRKIVMRTVDL